MNKKLLKSVAAFFAVAVLGVSCADNKATEPEIKIEKEYITQPSVSSLSVKASTSGAAADSTVDLTLAKKDSKTTKPAAAVEVEVDKTGFSAALIEAAGTKTDFIKYNVKSVKRSLKSATEVQEGDTLKNGINADTSTVNVDSFVIAAAETAALEKFTINIKDDTVAAAIQEQFTADLVGIFEVVVEATAEGFNPSELTVFVKITAHAAQY